MLVSGLQPFTLCDFPGHVAAVVFTQGCDFRCPFCHNASLLPFRPPDGRAGLPVDELWRRLSRRDRLLQGVVVSGGEPTVHDDLAAFLARIRSLGLRVKLDTNGSRPTVIKELLCELLVDYEAM